MLSLFLQYHTALYLSILFENLILKLCKNTYELKSMKQTQHAKKQYPLLGSIRKLYINEKHFTFESA